MKKEYVIPNLNVVTFSLRDVVLSSPNRPEDGVHVDHGSEDETTVDFDDILGL